MRINASSVVLALCVSSGVVLSGHDPWEFTLSKVHDDSYTDPTNALLHGQAQRHDLEADTANADDDYAAVETQPRRSYQLMATGIGMCFEVTINCASLDRVTTANVVLTEGTGMGGSDVLRFASVVRWIATTGGVELSRVTGPANVPVPAGNGYDITFLDTTYEVSRWNNSGTQTTVFLVRNSSPSPVNVEIHFYNAAGAHLYTHSVAALAANGLATVATASIGALAGQSGSATIAHTGGYGALSAKAVALEPATGFSFDTVATPVPY